MDKQQEYIIVRSKGLAVSISFITKTEYLTLDDRKYIGKKCYSFPKTKKVLKFKDEIFKLIEEAKLIND